MRIPDLITSPALTIEKTRADLLGNLKPGQQLEARVTDSRKDNSLTLRIGLTDVAAQSNSPLQPGEKLLLRVIKPTQPLELLILGRTGANDALARALRKALPSQLPLSRLVNQTASTAPAGNQSPISPTLTGALNPGARPSTGGVPLPGTTSPLGDTRPLSADARPVPAAMTGNPAQSTPGTGNQSKAHWQILQGIPGTKVSQALTRIVDQLLTADKPLTASRLRLAFQDSGLFLESRLASGELPANDLKANLLRLLFEIKVLLNPVPSRSPGKMPEPGTNLPPIPGMRLIAELLAQSEGALARTLVHQLASVPAEDNTQQVWQFELPVKHQESACDWLIKLTRHKSSQAENEEVLWTVRLDFDLPSLGPVSARLALQDEVISSHFTAQRAESAEKLDRSMPILAQAFERAGLKPGKLTASQGDTRRDEQPTRHQFPLLDEKA
ncbi:MAG: hypothetical protein GY703_00260 [Gammaproteobacteria bacterium]|nr:hypothetical protein [Gammaproteobacteria bacterium]